MVHGCTRSARQFITLFATSWGFANTAKHLERVFGWKVSAQTVKRVAYAEGVQVEQWREQQPATEFAAAEGNIEFQTDGTTVNTVEGGYKEVKIAVFLKRLAGEATRTAFWSTHSLPAPHVRSIRVWVGHSDDFASTWRSWAALLGITLFTLMTVIADGAKWIWRQAAVQFPGSRGVIDIYHVLEHVSAATKAVHGAENGTGQAWYDCAIRAILGDGWLGLCDWVGRWRTHCEPDQREGVRRETEALFTYLSEHTEHLGYCERLAKGLTIGSGQIEGSCKYVVGRRLKRSGRWRLANVRKMAVLCSTHYADDWDQYWDSKDYACPC